MDTGLEPHALGEQSLRLFILSLYARICHRERLVLEKGYRGHNAENLHRVFISGQKRGVSGVIKRELRRRSAAHSRDGDQAFQAVVITASSDRDQVGGEHD